MLNDVALKAKHAGIWTTTATDPFTADLHFGDGRLLLLYSFILIFVYPIASLASGGTSNWIGRRYTLLLSLLLFFLGSLIATLARNSAVFLLGHFFVDTVLGYTRPIRSGGFLASFVEIFAAVGILLGEISAYFCSNGNLSWRVMFGLGTIPLFLLSLSVIAFPESPYWLVSGGKLGEAKRVLTKTSENAEAAETRLATLKSAAGVPEHCSNDVVSPPKPALIAAVGLNFFRHGRSRRPGFPSSGVGTGGDQEREGDLARNNIRPIDPHLVLTAGFSVDKMGRRPLLLASVVGVIPSLVVLGLDLGPCYHPSLKMNWAVALSLATSLSFHAFFSIGLGRITWIYNSEMFPPYAQGESVGTAATAIDEADPATAIEAPESVDHVAQSEAFINTNLKI
ncbi:Major facilitator, sugar transporter-like [Parasponia andersonii]|uniref:Major facilitator, sugar transporter-like n=1 Tax=Parasponia andersonii TaxID=3476 RepID=A0A2P5D334_PARAD|nr:Major facilitator, sugar transporter-like [Parasponia andersonii]